MQNTFKRRPGCLLNDLNTFHLRLVSRGILLKVSKNTSVDITLMSLFLSLNNLSTLMKKIWSTQHGSSHWMCSVNKGVLKIFAKFTGKHLCQSLFFNTLQKHLYLPSTSGRLLLPASKHTFRVRDENATECVTTICKKL